MSKYFRECGGSILIQTVEEDIANYEEHGDPYDETGNEGFTNRQDYINNVYAGFE